MTKKGKDIFTRRFLTLICSLALPFALALAAQKAAAQETDLFTIRDIPLYVEAETAQCARDRAIADGQMTAVREMMKRLTLSRDWPHLPAVSAGEASRLVSSIQLGDEKIAANRYQASMTAVLESEGIRNILRRNNIAFSEARYKPVLVLPAYVSSGLVSLMTSDTPLRRAWIKAARNSGLVPYLVPGVGETAGDFVAIDNVLSLDSSAVGRLRRQADAGAVVASRVDVFSAPDQRPRIRVRFRNYEQTDIGITNITMTARDGETLDQLVTRAVTDMRTDIEDQWKYQTLTGASEGGQLQVSVPLESLPQWRDIQNQLENNSLVERVEILELTSEDARLALHFQGQISQLQLSLAQADLVLSRAEPAPLALDSDETWQLTRREDRVN